MQQRRRKADQPNDWWHARPGFVAALLMSPVVWIAVVKGVNDVYERLATVESKNEALQKDVARHEAELQSLRTHRR